MTSIKKRAERDAEEWTRAKLAIGEGAGNRRKLINETVAFSMQNIDGYGDHFAAAVEKQDVAAMAKQAERDDRRKKVNKAVARNSKALVTGKVENASTAVVVIAAIAVVMHKTGADKKVGEFMKLQYTSLKRRWRKVAKQSKATGPNRHNVFNLTDVR